MSFPQDWAPGCPPSDSVSAHGVVYRIVVSNPCQESDFLSFDEEKRVLRSLPPCPCMPLGLSVFPDKEDAAYMSRKMPRLGKFLTRGNLSPADGVTKLTAGQRPSHTTWWPSCECVRLDLFSEVEEVA